MATLTQIGVHHFDGGSNLNPGSRRDTDEKILSELMRDTYTDVVALEAADVALDARVDTVEAFVGGRDPKDSCRLCTAAALDAYTAAGTKATKTLTADAVGALTIDGVAAAEDDRVLVNNDGTVVEEDRGIFVVTEPGDAETEWVLTRASDANSNVEVTSGMYMRVEEGTANAGTAWILTTDDPIDLDVDELSFRSWDKYGLAANVADVTKEAAAAGTSDLIARADHKHDISTAAPGDALGLAAAEGDATSVARSNHVHTLGSDVIKRGTATSAGGGDEVVAFAAAFPDADYTIVLGSVGVALAVVKAATKAAEGFTLTFGAAGDCDWIAIHN